MFFIEIIKLRPLDAVVFEYLRPLRFDCVFYIEGRRHGELCSYRKCSDTTIDSKVMESQKA